MDLLPHEQIDDLEQSLEDLVQVNNAVAPRGGDVIETIGSAWVLCGVETTHLQPCSTSA